MIHFDRVTKRYPGGHEGLSEISFRLKAGEMVFLTGHSGAGKSTLLKLVGLLERPTRGHVHVNGRNLGSLARRRVPFHRRELGMIFQDHRLLHDRTVFDNVALPLVVAGVGHKDMGKRVRAALDKVGLLHKERALPIALSGGEQQRWVSPVRWSTAPPYCWRTNPQATWTRNSHARSYNCSICSVR